MHQIQVDYFERGGQEYLTVNWKGPGLIGWKSQNSNYFILLVKIKWVK